MTLFMWRILCLASVALFVIGIFVLACFRFLKNKYYHNFTADELIKTEKTQNSKNFIYFTSGETKKYIKKYVLCKTAYDKYLVCNFAEPFENIAFFVIQYTRRKRVISVLNLTQTNTGDCSKIIALKRKCAYVNVVVGSVNGLEINSDIIRPLPLRKIRLNAFFRSFVMFLGLFIIRHALIELMGGEFTKQYLNNFLNYTAVFGSFVLALISYFITVACLRRKSIKSSHGGALEYEFV